MSNFLFIGNGSYRNYGCEAIVRGTETILLEYFKGCSVTNIYSTNYPDDKSNLDDRPSISHAPYVQPERMSFRWLYNKITKKNGYLDYIKNAVPDIARNSRAIFSIGGDNYTLDYESNKEWLVPMGKIASKTKRPFIIWGASIGPFENDPEYKSIIMEHFQNDVTAFFVREQRSLDYLNELGFGNKAFKMADPAFLMEPLEPKENNSLNKPFYENAIGINLSPIMYNFITGGDQQAWNDLSKQIIIEIRKTFSENIVLIPHVTIHGTSSSDYEFMKSLFSEEYMEKNRIRLLPETLNAPKTKWIISRLKCLVASRTHATIAGFSTGVPTVSLAYSRKAFGINEQIFGHTDYLVSSDNMKHVSEVIKIVNSTIENKNDIKIILDKKISEEKESAISSGIKLKEIISE